MNDTVKIKLAVVKGQDDEYRPVGFINCYGDFVEIAAGFSGDPSLKEKMIWVTAEVPVLKHDTIKNSSIKANDHIILPDKNK